MNEHHSVAAKEKKFLSPNIKYGTQLCIVSISWLKNVPKAGLRITRIIRKYKGKRFSTALRPSCERIVE